MPADEHPTSPVDDPSAWDNSPGPAMPAWLLSVVLHFTVLTGFVLLWRVEPRGSGDETARPGGLVLVRNVSGRTEFVSGDSQSAASEATATTNPTSLPASTPAASFLEGALPTERELNGGGATSGELVADAGGMTRVGLPSRNLSGATGSTGVFGVKGEGNKFVYVFDRSSSMNGFEGRPLAAAKSELLSSLQQLGGAHQFQIIFYNQHPQILNPDQPRPPRLMFGDRQGKETAAKFIQGVEARGGTRHLEPLKMALAMQPDVVFFLTDALEPALSPSEMNQIRRLNRRAASINTIEFGVGPRQGGSNFLVRLARENGGEYVYVDVTKLRTR